MPFLCRRGQAVSDFDSRGRLDALCQKKGVPITIQRRVIYEFIDGRRDHPTADQVYEGIRGRLPAVSRTTVYRVLNTLIQIGAIRKISHPEAIARFDADTRRHHHVVCKYCDRLADLHAPAFDRLPIPDATRLGYHIEDYCVQFVACCQECRRKRAQAEAERLAQHPVPAGGD
ncbi:MAG: transcriptional repressor [Phycisphaerae bacterium]|nr:transcriptional repressor [Phycisphaerae bacterium]